MSVSAILWSNWTSKGEGSGHRETKAMSYSFMTELSGSFTCPVYSTDTWDLGLQHHPNNLVGQGIKLPTHGLTI